MQQTPLIYEVAPVNGFAANAKGTCEIPVGPSYDGFIIELQATKATSGGAVALSAILDDIVIKSNGKVARQHTATQLDALNTLNGAGFGYRTTTTAVSSDTIHNIKIPIFFAEPWRKSWATRRLLSWPTYFANGFKRQIGLELTAAAAFTDLSAVSIKVHAIARMENGILNKDGTPYLKVVKFDRREFGYTGTGQLSITTLPKGDGYCQTSLFMPDTDVISEVELQADKLVIRRATKAINDADLVQNGELNASGLSAYRFDLVFDRSDDLRDALQTAGMLDFQIKPTISVASATSKLITVISQMIGEI